MVNTVTINSNSGDVDPDDPPVFYITLFANLDGCGYVEITTLPVYPDTEGDLEYTVDLPLGNYDVVASAEGYIPDTGHAALDSPLDTATVDLTITEQPGN